MNNLDYTYIFTPIGEKNSEVQLINHKKKTPEHVSIKLKDRDFLRQGGKRLLPLGADLLDIATAVYLADRLSIRQEDMPCRIKIIVAIRCLEILNETAILNKFQDILQWYTDDHWFLEFTNYSKPGRQSEMQMHLHEPVPYPTKMTLWSGGLDALAGLYQQISDYKDHNFILVGSGSNNMIYNLQKEVYKSMNNKFMNRLTLIRIPISPNNIKTHSKSSTQRTRGFVFILQGIACAYSLGLNTLHLYENGVGAFNLPYFKSEVGLDHSRSVHPLSLYYLGELATVIFGKPFYVHNPFVFHTKAEMCKRLYEENNTDLIFGTVSCDKRHRLKTPQCGYCSSCLLRRQALAALNIEDLTKYVIKEETSRQRKPSDSEHLIAMISQVEDLRTLLNHPNPWFSMTKRYQWLQETVERTSQKEDLTENDMIQKWLYMYKNYVQEWDIAKPLIALGLLKNTGNVV